MEAVKKLPAELMACWKEYEKQLESISPFEIKNELISMAQKHSKKAATLFLNAGRGNPNWIATVPREAFFLIGMFGMEECRRIIDIPEGIAGIPLPEGVADRFKEFMKKNASHPGAELLQGTFDYLVREHNFNPEELLYAWAEAVIGDQYPTPDRILKFCSVMVQDYLIQEMGGQVSEGDNYDLFATEGGTAGMCYVFDSLTRNKLLNKGDHIAIMTPIFTPYLEIPQLEEFDFKVTYIEATQTDADGDHTWQFPKQEIEKLKDPSIKLLCVVNPSNPPSYALDPKTMELMAQIVKNDNPTLMIVTDDVYGTFVPDFKSLMVTLPQNTLCVYSFSKFFGATGWRLAVIALHKDNVIDRQIAALSPEKKERLKKRYESITLEPEKLKFIDRLVADSRLVALNHTAGLSTPQQMQMTLFAASSMLDKEHKYKDKMQKIIQGRLEELWKNTGFTLLADPLRAGYYSEIDIAYWARKENGEEFVKFLTDNYNPLDIVIRLARETGVVLLNGGGFSGPAWSVRVSLANLNKEDYTQIGKAIRNILEEYVGEWKNHKA